VVDGVITHDRPARTPSILTDPRDPGADAVAARTPFVPSITAEQVDYMRDAVFFDGPDAPRRLSRFWILLILAAIIASSGVIADSTATVIGAMIVAPLMIPIQGTMLASVLGDRANLARSIGLVATAAAAAVAIGFTLALLVPNDVTAITNSQVAGRVNPNLIDLVAALATGAVGSIALIRRDISDTLPGVAIAISLVPPLAVVGITLEAGETGQSWGALLLFITNVTAILAVGSVVMALYRVRRSVQAGPENGASNAVRPHRSPLVIAAMLLLVAVPLTASSLVLVQQRSQQSDVYVASQAWAVGVGWDVVAITSRDGKTVVRLTGPLPIPDSVSLRNDLVAAGVDVSTVRAEFFPSEAVEFSS
jgi:uncharacterized hydrophobic protein (TIGR00271 family)